MACARQDGRGFIRFRLRLPPKASFRSFQKYYRHHDRCVFEGQPQPLLRTVDFKGLHNKRAGGRLARWADDSGRSRRLAGWTRLGALADSTNHSKTKKWAKISEIQVRTKKLTAPVEYIHKIDLIVYSQGSDQSPEMRTEMQPV